MYTKSETMLDMGKLLKQIEKMQEGQDLSCECLDCYWNMYFPKTESYKGEQAKHCVSESLADFKMTPNKKECRGYWSYEEACGIKKGEKRESLI